MSRVKVSVTQEDIDKGKREDCTRCPVALALTRRGCGFVNVGAYGISGIYDGLAHYFITPRSVERFIKRFDDGKPVAPFNFILRYS